MEPQSSANQGDKKTGKASFSNLELINKNDSFPYQSTDPKAYEEVVEDAYRFRVQGEDYPIGYVTKLVVDELRGLEWWTVNEGAASGREVVLKGNTAVELTQAMDDTIGRIGPQLEVLTDKSGKEEFKAVKQSPSKFKVLYGWRDEEYPIFGKGGKVLFKMERAATPLFGVVTYGCHLTAYFYEGDDPNKKAENVRLWVGKRSETKQTYPSMLDNTVGGGIKLGQTPLDCLCAESEEEAGLDPERVRKNAQAAGDVSYYHIRTKDAGGEVGLLQPEVQYVYDLEVDQRTKLKNEDGEVAGFEVLSIETVKEYLKEDKFKPNCASIILDFLIRHEFLTPKDDSDFDEIVARLHRQHEFPTQRGEVSDELRNYRVHSKSQAMKRESSAREY